MKDLLLASCGAFVFVNILQIDIVFGIKRKPFTCDICMSGWFFLLLYFLPEWADIPFYMAGAMIATRLINYGMTKTL
jgi:hypothetical protein